MRWWQSFWRLGRVCSSCASAVCSLPRIRTWGPTREFVSEHWLDFEASEDVSSGGVGVLGVRFACETDGAVAPLRGLFPTVTFHGQAAEVVVRRPPPPGIGFESSRFVATEGPGSRELVFTVTSLDPVTEDVVVSYQIVAGSTATGGTRHLAGLLQRPGRLHDADDVPSGDSQRST